MKLIILIVAAIVIVVLAYTGLQSRGGVKVVPDTPEQQQEISAGTEAIEVTEFSWVTKARDEDAAYPKTDVLLKIGRSDGSSDEKFIATVDGSCNILPSESALALGSEQLHCYYAGFGYQFRILAEGDAYAVQQKEIEEASPDYNPPIADFKTILKIDARS
jgi:hypothetical protein